MVVLTQKGGLNTSVGFCKNVGNDASNLIQKVLSFISKSRAEAKEVIQYFDNKTTNTNRIKCDCNGTRTHNNLVCKRTLNH